MEVPRSPIIDSPERLIYRFDGSYCATALIADALKAQGNKITRYLLEAAQRTGCDLFFADFTYTRSGVCGKEREEDYYHWHETPSESSSDDDDDASVHVIEDEEEALWSLETIYTSDGDLVAQDIWFDEENLIQKDGLETEDPDFEEYEPRDAYTRARTKHTYDRSCIIIIPRALSNGFLSLGSYLNLQTWLEVLLQDVNEDRTRGRQILLNVWSILQGLWRVCSTIRG